MCGCILGQCKEFQCISMVLSTFPASLSSLLSKIIVEESQMQKPCTARIQPTLSNIRYCDLLST